MEEGMIPPQAIRGRSPPYLMAGLFIYLSVIFMKKLSFISFFISQIITPLVEVMKTNYGLKLVLLVFVTVCVFLVGNINRNENASSYDNNDEHEWISRNSRSNPDDDDLPYHYYQQREDRVQEERRESNSHVSSGTTSPSPQAGARRKPLSPLKRSSWSSSEDEKASSSSNSPSFGPFLQPPPLPPFEIRPQKYTLYARIQSDNSSSCDSPDPMSSSPDINVKSDHFIRKVKAELEEQGRGRSNLAGPRSSKTRRKKRSMSRIRRNGDIF